MNREQMMESVKSQMPEKRWNHTLGVIESAIWLAEQYGANPQQAEIAAILHDVCKYWPVDKQAQVVIAHQMDVHVLDYAKELWHAPAGACIAQTQYGVEDIAIQDAIRYHTSGRKAMSLLDKIICLADYIEPGRQFSGVERVRNLAHQHLEQALVAGLDSTILYLIEKNVVIYPVTIEARNDLLAQIQITST